MENKFIDLLRPLLEATATSTCSCTKADYQREKKAFQKLFKAVVGRLPTPKEIERTLDF